MGSATSACKLHTAHVPLSADGANAAAAVLLAQYGSSALISVESGTRTTVSGTIRYDATNPSAQFDVVYAIRKLLPCADVSGNRDTVRFSCRTAPAAVDA
jgi:hypothetical protein